MVLPLRVLHRSCGRYADGTNTVSWNEATTTDWYLRFESVFLYWQTYAKHGQSQPKAAKSCWCGRWWGNSTAGGKRPIDSAPPGCSVHHFAPSAQHPASTNHPRHIVYLSHQIGR